MVLIMNKSDLKLIIVMILVILVIYFAVQFTKVEGTNAIVYYEDEDILNIDLSIDNEYIVDGELGDVVLEVKNGKIRVKKENSPKNICSKEGFIGDSSRTLICLPNKIIVKIVGDSEIDGVVY